MKAIHIAILVVALLAGLLLFDIMRAVNAANSLRVEEIQLEDLDVDLGWRFKVGIPPVEPYIERVDAEILMRLNNPTDYELRVRELEYEIFLNGRPAASGKIEDVDVPPGGRVLTVPLSVDAEEALSALLEAVASAVRKGTPYLDFRYEVRGRAKVPITLLGMELPMQVDVPFRREGTYRFSFNLPSVFVRLDAGEGTN